MFIMHTKQGYIYFWNMIHDCSTQRFGVLLHSATISLLTLFKLMTGTYSEKNAHNNMIGCHDSAPCSDRQ